MLIVEPKNVVRLDVAMNETGTMRTLQTCCNVQQHAFQFVHSQREGSRAQRLRGDGHREPREIVGIEIHHGHDIVVL
jgi:hypothetical protein